MKVLLEEWGDRSKQPFTEEIFPHNFRCILIYPPFDLSIYPSALLTFLLLQTWNCHYVLLCSYFPWVMWWAWNRKEAQLHDFLRTDFPHHTLVTSKVTIRNECWGYFTFFTTSHQQSLLRTPTTCWTCWMLIHKTDRALLFQVGGLYMNIALSWLAYQPS